REGGPGSREGIAMTEAGGVAVIPGEPAQCRHTVPAGHVETPECHGGCAQRLIRYESLVEGVPFDEGTDAHCRVGAVLGASDWWHAALGQGARAGDPGKRVGVHGIVEPGVAELPGLVSRDLFEESPRQRRP